MSAGLGRFKSINLVDFEFGAAPGSNPAPVCLVVRDLVSGRVRRIWRDDLVKLREAPFECGPDSLFVAYYASAEIGCFIELGWPKPANVLDLFAEFRCQTNTGAKKSSSLLGALIHFGLPAMEAVEKTAMRDLILGGGPWTGEEQTAILDYCQSDVDSMALLLPALLPKINLELALIRGRFMGAAAEMEHTGVPIDVELLGQLRARWDDIQADVIREMDVDDIYDGATFRKERWAQWLIAKGIPWPQTKAGALMLDKDTFSDMAAVYPVVAPIKELRKTLSQITHLYSLSVGPDNRNRCLLSAFGASTGRNTPRGKEFIFNKPAWFRGLIKPEPGIALAYVDYSQQELAIAAFLSGDLAMQRAYLSGDFYIGFAIEAGVAPKGATKQSHAGIREAFKSVSLGVLYGMGPGLLAQKIGKSVHDAREQLELHRRTFKTYWAWSSRITDTAALTRELHTRLGWQLHLDGSVPRSPGSIGNFPVQANAAEMLRVAAIAVTEAGIAVAAPIHDALLIQAPVGELDEVVQQVQQLMAQAGAAILGGQPLRTDVKVVLPPARYEDPKGVHMWRVVMGALERLK